LIISPAPESAFADTLFIVGGIVSSVSFLVMLIGYYLDILCHMDEVHGLSMGHGVECKDFNTISQMS
jgi:hypothetical protein